MKQIPSLAQRNSQRNWSGKSPERQKALIAKRKQNKKQK